MTLACWWFMYHTRKASGRASASNFAGFRGFFVAECPETAHECIVPLRNPLGIMRKLDAEALVL